MKKLLLILVVAIIMTLPHALSANSKEALLNQCIPTRMDVPAPKGTIYFVYGQQTISRASDGVLTYRQLLKNIPNYNDYTELDFKGILFKAPKDGSKLVQIGCDAAQEKVPSGYNGTPPPTKNEPGLNAPDGFGNWQIPDSTKVAGAMEKFGSKVKGYFLHGVPSVKAFFGPAADILLWILIIVSPLLVGILGLSLYFAETSATETIQDVMGTTIAGAGWVRDVHNSTAPVALLCCWAIMFVLLLWTLVWIVNQGLGIFGLLIWFFFLRKWASKWTSKIVPNVKMITTGGAVVEDTKKHH